MIISEILIACFLFLIFVVIIAIFIVNKKDKIKRLKDEIENGSFDKESKLAEFHANKSRKIVALVLLSIILGSSITIFGVSLSYRTYKNDSNNIVLSINSNSMATALSSNDYIIKNNIKDKIYQYDVVKFKKVNNIEEIKLYDIVLYEKEVNTKTILVAHRIIKINDDGTFETRGDNNMLSDEYNLEFSKIKGTYLETLGFASFINYLTYTPGFYVLFAGCSTLLILIEVYNEKEKKLISLN